MTLYEQLQDAGIAIDNHHSDLYCEDTEKARSIIDAHEVGVSFSTFTSKDGRAWLDIPFRYDPYWQAKRAKADTD